MAGQNANRQPVDFDLAAVVVQQERQRGDHELLSSQVNQHIQNLAGSVQALQGDFRHLAEGQSQSNAMLHQIQERSSGIERLATALERGGTTHGEDITALKLSVAEWKGFVKASAIWLTFAISSVTAYTLYRFDKLEAAVTILQSFHMASERGASQ